jgi:glyoxylate utilization-related uncharacterized protein
MRVTRISDAKPYETKGHFAMTGMRLQGFDASPSTFAWVGLSHFLPAGGAERSGSPIEKIYVVLSGHVTVVTDGGEATLGALDSCFLEAGEAREIINRTTLPASMLVIMPYPDKT